MTVPEDGPVPRELVAVTEQVYEVLFVKVLTVIGDALPDPKIPPQLTEYVVIGLPPLDVGAVNEIVACPSPGVAVPIVGAPGTEPEIPKLIKTVAAALKDALPG